MGLLLIPTLVVKDDQVRVQEGVYNSSARANRAARLASNPKRAAALVNGRKRLAKAISFQNEGRESLATLRLAAGLSQEQLAAKLGMQQPNVARMERRPGDVAMSRIKELAGALGVSNDRVMNAIDVANESAGQL